MIRPLVLATLAAACQSAFAQTQTPDPVPSRAPVQAPLPGAVTTNPATPSIGAQAAQSPFYVGIQQGFTRETNPGLAINNEPRSSDTFSTTTLRAGVSQPLSRQRLYGDVELRHIRHSNRSDFDNTGYALNAGLDFATVERISGTVAAHANRSRPRLIATSLPDAVGQGFASGSVGIAKTEELRAVGRIGVSTPLTVEAGAEYRNVGYSTASSLDYDQTRGHGALIYRFSSATNVGLGVAASKSNYTTDKGDRSDIYVQGQWTPSASTDLQARVARTKNERDFQIQQNYTGLTGSLTWSWRPTGKVAMSTYLARDTGQDIGFLRLSPEQSVSAADFSTVSSSAGIRGTYEATAKVLVDVGGSWVERDMANRFVSGPRGKTTVGTLTMGARWMPTRNITAGCHVSREQQSIRSFDTVGTAYTRRPVNNLFGCFGAYTFF